VEIRLKKGCEKTDEKVPRGSCVFNVPRDRGGGVHMLGKMGQLALTIRNAGVARTLGRGKTEKERAKSGRKICYGEMVEGGLNEAVKQEKPRIVAGEVSWN